MKQVYIAKAMLLNQADIQMHDLELEQEISLTRSLARSSQTAFHRKTQLKRKQLRIQDENLTHIPSISFPNVSARMQLKVPFKNSAFAFQFQTKENGENGNNSINQSQSQLPELQLQLSKVKIDSAQSMKHKVLDLRQIRTVIKSEKIKCFTDRLINDHKKQFNIPMQYKLSQTAQRKMRNFQQKQALIIKEFIEKGKEMNNKLQINDSSHQLLHTSYDHQVDGDMQNISQITKQLNVAMMHQVLQKSFESIHSNDQKEESQDKLQSQQIIIAYPPNNNQNVISQKCKKIKNILPIQNIQNNEKQLKNQLKNKAKIFNNDQAADQNNSTEQQILEHSNISKIDIVYNSQAEINIQDDDDRQSDEGNSNIIKDNMLNQSKSKQHLPTYGQVKEKYKHLKSTNRSHHSKKVDPLLRQLSNKSKGNNFYSLTSIDYKNYKFQIPPSHIKQITNQPFEMAKSKLQMIQVFKQKQQLEHEKILESTIMKVNEINKPEFIEQLEKERSTFYNVKQKVAQQMQRSQYGGIGHYSTTSSSWLPNANNATINSHCTTSTNNRTQQLLNNNKLIFLKRNKYQQMFQYNNPMALLFKQLMNVTQQYLNQMNDIFEQEESNKFNFKNQKPQEQSNIFNTSDGAFEEQVLKQRVQMSVQKLLKLAQKDQEFIILKIFVENCQYLENKSKLLVERILLSFGLNSRNEYQQISFPFFIEFYRIAKAGSDIKEIELIKYASKFFRISKNNPLQTNEFMMIFRILTDQIDNAEDGQTSSNSSLFDRFMTNFYMTGIITNDSDIVDFDTFQQAFLSGTLNIRDLIDLIFKCLNSQEVK